MRRIDLERYFRDHGCELLREGGRHSIWQNPSLDLRASVPRHREIPIGTARAICRLLGIPRPPSS